MRGRLDAPGLYRLGRDLSTAQDRWRATDPAALKMTEGGDSGFLIAALVGMAIADGTSNCPIVAPHRRVVRVLAAFGTAKAVPFHKSWSVRALPAVPLTNPTSFEERMPGRAWAVSSR